jgi:haloalkane dehalogenase
MERYGAPFPTVRSRRAVRQWPCEIPIDGKPADVHEAIRGYSRWLCTTDLPKLMLVADPGAIVSPDTAKWAEENFPSLTRVDIGRGLHFIQEDSPDEIGTALSDWMKNL